MAHDVCAEACADAFASVPNAFPGYSVPLIKLGEANGELAEAVSLVANRFEEESSLRSEVRAALTYPVFLIVVSLSVVLFMFVSVVPQFGDIVADSPEEIGGSMKALLVVSNVLLDFAWIWTSLAVLLLGGTVYLWRQGKIQSVIWASLRRLPGIAAVVEAWEVIQFCNSMGHLLAGRVSVLDAIQLSGESISNEHLQKKLVSTCDLIRQGESLGRALSAVDVFPKLVVQMVAVGEKSAHLARAMEEISKLYTRRMRESIRKTLSVLEPAVIAVMGIVVGFIIISLLTAIISVNDIPL